MMVKNLITGLSRQHELKGSVVFAGNWNYKFKGEPMVLSKPLGVMNFGNYFEVVFTHADILKLLSVYLEADLVSVSMINAGNVDTGKVISAEKLFVDKVKDWGNKINEN